MPKLHCADYARIQLEWDGETWLATLLNEDEIQPISGNVGEVLDWIESYMHAVSD